MSLVGTRKNCDSGVSEFCRTARDRFVRLSPTLWTRQPVHRITRHNPRRTAAVALAIALLAIAGLTQTATAADPRDPIQREDIALIEKQLQRIDWVIDRLAQRQRAQPNRRVILDTGRLRADLNDVRNGLRAYLSPPRMLPRQPTPLSGAYRAQRAEIDP